MPYKSNRLRKEPGAQWTMVTTQSPLPVAEAKAQGIPLYTCLYGLVSGAPRPRITQLNKPGITFLNPHKTKPARLFIILETVFTYLHAFGL